MASTRILLLILILSHPVWSRDDDDENEEKSPEEQMYGVKFANECEVCKYLVIELENRLKETGKTHDVIETGYELDPATKKRKKYTQSELRLIESLDGICDSLLKYNIHKERKDSTRFAKGMSTTFKVLHDLVDKGVKVELGIPLDLWDKPSAEVTHLKSQCENLVEKYEDAITNWYFSHQDIPLRKFLCVDRALKKGDDDCLQEELPPEIANESKGDKQKTKTKTSSAKKSSVNKDPETEKEKEFEKKVTKEEL